MHCSTYGTTHPQFQPNIHVTQLWARLCMCVHAYGLIAFVCKLYVACPCTVIHTLVYYYKLVAYADRRVCTKSII